MTHSPVTDDKPLDPAQAAVVQRLRRLMLISSVIMLGGLLAVFGVIAYRLSTTTTTAETDAPIEANIGLPKGARVLSTTIANGRATVTMDLGGRTEARVYDLATQKQLGRVTFRPQP
jgi:Family of unknown function (DUF6476)